MAINALRGRSDTGDTRPGTPAIGEDDANIVDCPVCKRPLDATSRRCPGCGTMLIGGVQASKATLFVAFGLAIGLMGGAGAMSVATLGVRTPAASLYPPLPTRLLASRARPSFSIRYWAEAGTAAASTGTAATAAARIQ